MKIKKFGYLFVITTISLILVAACTSSKTAEDDALDGTSWQLKFYRKTTPIPGSSITARFAGGEITGSAGCNTYGGVYQINGPEISISDINFTEMACMDPEGVMEQEQMYLEWLNDAYIYQLSDEQLQIFWTAQEALTFVPED
ncbi:MAG: META domain-containing protein [Chloroflexota bacterium]|nr:META domain-containing protein [Chloroflexota bacterium]